MIERKEDSLKKKRQQIDSQRSKLLSEEQILQRHRTRISTNPDSAHTQDLLIKKELYVKQLRKKLQKVEQEKQVLNACIENAKREKNILYVPKILGEKNNILFAAYNLPIQGLGCELMAVALTKTYYGLIGTSAQIINCVHDEIVIECDKIEAKMVSEILRDSMLNAFYEMFPSYINTGTGLVDTKIAKNWGEAK